MHMSRSSHRRYSVKKLLLQILQNSQENTCLRVSFLIKLQARPATLLKKRLWHRCFPVNFAKFVRATFLQNTSGRLLKYLLSTKRFDSMNSSNIVVRKLLAKPWANLYFFIGKTITILDLLIKIFFLSYVIR